MEVHAHSHTPRKKWTHYFWEFLMLFLAVFCGFLAEYQLEHKIEKDKEKQYIQSLVEDLKNDTLSLANAIIKNIDQIKGKDSFVLLLDKGTWTNEEVAVLYDMHWRHIGYINAPLYSKRTINQLMNAGGLRLIRKKAVSDSITIYSTYCDYVATVQQPAINTWSDKALESSAAIFDNNFIRFSPDLKIERLQTGTPALLTIKREAIKLFAFMLEQDKDALIIGTISLKKNKELAEQLLLLIQKTYKTN